jgi:hypothetical protein
VRRFLNLLSKQGNRKNDLDNGLGSGQMSMSTPQMVKRPDDRQHYFILGADSLAHGIYPCGSATERRTVDHTDAPIGTPLQLTRAWPEAAAK